MGPNPDGGLGMTLADAGQAPAFGSTLLRTAASAPSLQKMLLPEPSSASAAWRKRLRAVGCLSRKTMSKTALLTVSHRTSSGHLPGARCAAAIVVRNEAPAAKDRAFGTSRLSIAATASDAVGQRRWPDDGREMVLGAVRKMAPILHPC